jgi:hypothetical protein
MVATETKASTHNSKCFEIDKPSSKMRVEDNAAMVLPSKKGDKTTLPVEAGWVIHCCTAVP